MVSVSGSKQALQGPACHMLAPVVVSTSSREILVKLRV
jgi:hypothetical protein